jgi:hypothetical protein
VKLGYRPKEAAEALGAQSILDRMVAAGWLKPVLPASNRLTLYDGGDIAAAWGRLTGGEELPPLARKAKLTLMPRSAHVCTGRKAVAA